MFTAALVEHARRTIVRLTECQMMLATAESCTGGLLSGLLTEIPGSSQALERGFVTYSNAAKIQMLGVAPALIDDFGAVSAEVAQAMATGALANSDADIAVSITGIAGPDGGSADKPVGLIYLHAATTHQSHFAKELHLGAQDRNLIRSQTLDHALDLIEVVLSKNP